MSSSKNSSSGNLPASLSSFIARIREIAKAMTIGVKTAETYVTRILNKLGFDSRVQVATWAIEKSLTSSVNGAGNHL